MIEWHFLNFGSKKLKASIDTDVRITGVKTLHIGHAMSFVVNQREGLQGLCLKAGSMLLNVSENLSMAFFWPKKPTNLELVEDRDLSNGEQWLSSYPEEAYDATSYFVLLFRWWIRHDNSKIHSPFNARHRILPADGRWDWFACRKVCH